MESFDVVVDFVVEDVVEDFYVFFGFFFEVGFFYVFGEFGLLVNKGFERCFKF